MVLKKIFWNTKNIGLSIASTLMVTWRLEQKSRRFFEKFPPRPWESAKEHYSPLRDTIPYFFSILRAHQERLEDMSAQCFEACVVDMYNRNLAEQVTAKWEEFTLNWYFLSKCEERDCIRKCSGKYLNVYLRCMERWQEIQVQQNQMAMAKQQEMMNSIQSGGDATANSWQWMTHLL